MSDEDINRAIGVGLFLNSLYAVWAIAMWIAS